MYRYADLIVLTIQSIPLGGLPYNINNPIYSVSWGTISIIKILNLCNFGGVLYIILYINRSLLSAMLGYSYTGFYNTERSLQSSSPHPLILLSSPLPEIMNYDNIYAYVCVFICVYE